MGYLDSVDGQGMEVMAGFRARPAPGGFFDVRKVQSASERAAFKVLAKFGAFVRVAARQSLKYGEKPSPSGSPPTVHKTGLRTKTNKKTGVQKVQKVSPFKEFIFFDVDRSTRSVVIGPQLLPGKIGKALPALEYGGLSMVIRRQKEVAAQISPHPTMQPALEKNVPKFPGLFLNQVK